MKELFYQLRAVVARAHKSRENCLKNHEAKASSQSGEACVDKV